MNEKDESVCAIEGCDELAVTKITSNLMEFSSEWSVCEKHREELMGNEKSVSFGIQ